MGNQGQSALIDLVILWCAPAEIAGTRLRTSSVMIAPVVHIPYHPTARPSKGMGSILIELLQVPFEFYLKRLLEVITFLKAARAKPNPLFLAHPSYQLQLAFVFRVILAFTVLIIPLSAKSLVYGPIF